MKTQQAPIVLGKDDHFSRHSVTVGDARMEYWDNDKSGPTLIMLHGFTGNHAGLVDTASRIDGVHIILPDLPGFGDSEIPAKQPYTIDALVELVVEFIGTLKLDEPPILHGHSLGSIVASRLAQKHPKVIASKMILQNPTSRTPLRKTDPRAVGALLGVGHYWMAKKAPGGKRLVRSETISKLLTKQIMTTKEPGLREAIAKHHIKDLQYIREHYYYDIYRSVLRHDVLEIAHDLRQEVLVIAGALDNVSPIKYQHELVTALPHGRIIELQNVGHLTHFETPDVVAQAMQEFIVSDAK